MSNHTTPSHKQADRKHPGHKPQPCGEPESYTIYVDRDAFSNIPLSVASGDSIQFKLGGGRTASATITADAGLFPITTISVTTGLSPTLVVSGLAGKDYTIITNQGVDTMQGTIRVGSGSGEDR
jgi:hypothetical protein